MSGRTMRSWHHLAYYNVSLPPFWGHPTHLVSCWPTTATATLVKFKVAHMAQVRNTNKQQRCICSKPPVYSNLKSRRRNHNASLDVYNTSQYLRASHVTLVFSNTIAEWANNLSIASHNRWFFKTTMDDAYRIC